MKSLGVNLAAGVLLLFGSASARAQAPKPGDAAPPIAVGALFQAPNGAKADLTSLRGNIVVIDFWATWCAPCIQSMPEFNALAERFRGKPIRFLSLSDERPEKVKKFLQKGLLKTWVVADPTGATNKAYDIQFIPRAAIIDAQGKLVTIMDPRELKPEMLDRLLRGESLTPPAETAPPKEPVKPREPVKAGESLHVFDIRPTDRPSNRSKIGLLLGEVQIDSAPFGEILTSVLGISPVRLITEGILPAGTYRLRVHLPAALHKETTPFVVKRLEECFGLSVRKERRRMKVAVLSAPKGAGADIVKLPEFNGHSTGPGMFGSRGTSLDSLSAFLEAELNQPVVNATSLTGSYEFNVLFKEGDRADLRRALEEIGLQLKEEEREVEVYVVTAPMPKS